MKEFRKLVNSEVMKLDGLLFMGYQAYYINRGVRVETVSYQAIAAGVQALKQGNSVAKEEMRLQPDNRLIDVSLHGADWPSTLMWKYIAIAYSLYYNKLNICDISSVFHSNKYFSFSFPIRST